jgi:4-amino-4-deoxy-L-arabinose transferase-like glycosyltransferase
MISGKWYRFKAIDSEKDARSTVNLKQGLGSWRNLIDRAKNSFYRSPEWYFSLVWLSFVCCIAFLWGLGNTGLIDETEPLFAEAARQITITNDWITPYFNGDARFDKPILIYWSIAFFYKTIGVNEWAVRLPSAISAVCLTLLTFYTLRYFGATNLANRPSSRRQLWVGAWVGSAIVAFNVQTIVWARTGVSDMLLSGCIGVTLLSFFWGYVLEGKQPSFNRLLPNRGYLAFYIFSALAVLTKGPVGIVLPILIIAAFCLYLGELKRVLRELKLFVGSLIFGIISLPWYVLVTLKNSDDFINAFFGYHNFDRFTGVVNGHGAPWYFYFLIVLGLFAPWSFYLPAALARIKFWRPIIWQHKPRQDRLGLFAFFWFVVIFGFFTIATTKLPSYVLPLIPAATILVTLFFNQNYLERPARFEASIIGNIILAIVIIIALFSLSQIVGRDSSEPELAKLIATSNLPYFAVAIWTITALSLLYILWQQKQWKWLAITNIASFALFIILFLNPLTVSLDRLRQEPLREITQTIVANKQTNDRIWMLGFKKPSVVFYSRERVVFVKNDDFLPAFRSQLEGYPNNISILLLTQDSHLKNLKLRERDYQIIDRRGTYLLIRLSKAKILATIPRNPTP